jgi:trigger factor
MDVQVVESGPCRRTLTIKLTPAQVREHLAQVFQSAARQVNMKGFRSGQVPRKVLEKRFGPAILTEAKQSLVQRSFDDACRERGLVPVSQPVLEGLGEEPLDEAKGLEFQIHVDIRPQFDLGGVQGLEITSEPTDVTDQDVQGALGELARQKRTLETVDSPIADGDFLKADVVHLDAAGKTALERKGIQLNTNIPIAGTDPQAFQGALVGKAPGDEVELELTFPDNFDRTELRGSKGKVRVHVHQVLRVQDAPLDDELAKSFDFESLDALTTVLRQRIGEEKVRSELVRQEEELLRLIAEDHPFELPRKMVEEQAAAHRRSLEARMKQNGMQEPEIQSRLDEAKVQLEQDAERRVRMFFLVEKIAREHKIFVTEGDVDVELRNIAAHNNVSVDEVREHYERNRSLGDLRLAVLERKVREFLRGSAKITDK